MFDMQAVARVQASLPLIGRGIKRILLPLLEKEFNTVLIESLQLNLKVEIKISEDSYEQILLITSGIDPQQRTQEQQVCALAAATLGQELFNEFLKQEVLNDFKRGMFI